MSNPRWWDSIRAYGTPWEPPPWPEDLPDGPGFPTSRRGSGLDLPIDLRRPPFRHQDHVHIHLCQTCRGRRFVPSPGGRMTLIDEQSQSYVFLRPCPTCVPRRPWWVRAARTVVALWRHRGRRSEGGNDG